MINFKKMNCELVTETHLAGKRRAPITGEDCRSNSDDDAPHILQISDLHALLGPLGQGGARWGLAGPRLRQHHRQLHPQRPCRRDGPHLRPSLRSQAMVRPEPDLPENPLPPPPRLRPHLDPLAQHGAHFLVARPGPRDHQHRQGLHGLLHPRALRPSLSPPAEDLPPDAGPHHSTNRSMCLRGHPPPTHQLHPRHLLRLEGQGSGAGLGM